MRPTSREIIEGIAEVLDARVTPVVDDRWAASSLRSIKALLAHLAVRVEAEGPILAADTADLRAVLRGAATRLAAAGAVAPLVAEIEDALGREWRPAGEHPTVESLTGENLVLRDLADRLLRALRGGRRHGAPPGGGEGRAGVEGDLAALDPAVRDSLTAEIHAYSRRQLAREQPLFMPAFTTPLY